MCKFGDDRASSAQPSSGSTGSHRESCSARGDEWVASDRGISFLQNSYEKCSVNRSVNYSYMCTEDDEALDEIPGTPPYISK